MNPGVTAVAERTRVAEKVSRGLGRRVAGVSRTQLVAAGFFVLALAFDLFRLGTPALWFDEALSANIARGPLDGLVYTYPAANMDLYYTLLFGWEHLLAFLGITATEFLVRLPSAIFAALAVAGLYLLGRRFVGQTAAIVAASLYLLSSYQLTAAQTARAYSLQLVFLMVAWYAWLRLMTGDAGRRWWVWYIAASVLGSLSQVMTIFSIFAQVVAFACLFLLPGLWQIRVRSRLRGMCASLAIIGGLLAPVLYASRFRPSKTGWVPVPHLIDIPRLYIDYLGNDNRLALWLVLGIGGIALLLVALFRFLPEKHRALARVLGENTATSPTLASLQELRPLGLTLVIWLTVPVAAAFVASVISSNHVFTHRYLVEVLPALYLLIGVGVQQLPWRRVQMVVTLGLVCATLLGVPKYYANAQVLDLRTPTQWLIQRYQSGDGIVCHFRNEDAGCQGHIFQYYLYDLHAHQIPAEVTATSPSPASVTDLAKYAAQHKRLFFIAGDYASAEDHAQALATQAWLDSHYTLLAQFTSKDGIVRLYATSTGA